MTSAFISTALGLEALLGYALSFLFGTRAFLSRLDCGCLSTFALLGSGLQNDFRSSALLRFRLQCFFGLLTFCRFLCMCALGFSTLRYGSCRLGFGLYLLFRQFARFCMALRLLGDPSDSQQIGLRAVVCLFNLRQGMRHHRFSFVAQLRIALDIGFR